MATTILHTHTYCGMGMRDANISQGMRDDNSSPYMCEVGMRDNNMSPDMRERDVAVYLYARWVRDEDFEGFLLYDIYHLNYRNITETYNS